MSKLDINGKIYKTDVDPDTPLLWVLRDELGLTGTKYGCGIAQCGACTVHIDGQAMRSCSVPVGSVAGKITTIEGLGDKQNLHPVQKAWIKHQVAQCGYCQSGQIMTAAAHLNQIPNTTQEDMVTVMSGNICRCGTYCRMKKAIKDLVQGSSPMQEQKTNSLSDQSL